MRRALLIGIDEYPHAPLKGCVNDAKLMEVLLRENETEPKKNFDCKLLTGPPGKISQGSLRQEIKQLFQDPADLALLHFSGHGFLNELGGYLVTPDASHYDEGVSMHDVLSWVNQSKNTIDEIVIFLDCCHSGAFGEDSALNMDLSIQREGVAILTATRSSQPALEVGGGGVFTSLVCEALRGGAADVQGKVSVASVYGYLDLALGAWQQRPLFKVNVPRFVPLRQCEPGVPLDVLRLIPEYFESSDTEFPLDPSYDKELKPRDPEHEAVMAHLRALLAARLVVPVGEEYMYHAAKNSTSCKLTPLGRFYWQLAKDKRI